VGKSHLLQRFVANQPLVLYVARVHTPREFLLALLNALHTADEAIAVPEDPKGISTTSLKGIAHRALDRREFLMALDHIDAPSREVTGIIKDLHYYGRTPVIFASRSPHMEDIGALGPLCVNKAERMELKNWPLNVALEFARREAERSGLWASNLESALPALVEWSGGNPGAILQILRMADQGAHPLRGLPHGPRIARQSGLQDEFLTALSRASAVTFRRILPIYNRNDLPKHSCSKASQRGGPAVGELRQLKPAQRIHGNMKHYVSHCNDNI
jgi:hypothetical protein